ncbi:MAG: hypothetical protein ACOH2K_02395 [Burkholderiaceae bacterium]
MATREELAMISGARAGAADAQLALGTRYLFGGGCRRACRLRCAGWSGQRGRTRARPGC